MEGKAVYKFAVNAIPDALNNVIAGTGLALNDIDLIIAHQANQRILESAIKHSGLPRSKFFIDIDEFGNTGAATIPLGLAHAVDSGKIKRGDHVILVGFGAGLSWGSLLLEF
jgi:3-oxoacyl-[acyl-carrier-protein] synthase-3